MLTNKVLAKFKQNHLKYFQQNLQKNWKSSKKHFSTKILLAGMAVGIKCSSTAKSKIRETMSKKFSAELGAITWKMTEWQNSIAEETVLTKFFALTFWIMDYPAMNRAIWWKFLPATKNNLNSETILKYELWKLLKFQDQKNFRHFFPCDING